MDSYGMFHPDTHLQTQNSSFWTPKHQILGFRGLGFLDAWGRILVVREGAGNILQYCCTGWLGWGGPKILGPFRLGGKMVILAPGPAVQQIAGLGQQD